MRLLIALLLLGLSSLYAQTPRFGGRYEELTARQKELVQLWTAEFEKIFSKQADPATLYDRLPLSARTTFEAVTHALSHTQLTSGSGKAYGTALDLVELVERVAGSVPGYRGDSQFRVYVYLRPGAIDKLYNSKEFKRDHDNTVFHIGYPVNFRQLGGVPSIQFSVERTGRRADIDVDYRPSNGVKALTSGHLTSANSDVRAGDNHVRHIRRWEGFGNWWRDLMAGRMTAGEAMPEVADFTPLSDGELTRKAHGPLPDMIHAYLKAWLIKQQPISLLPAISIKSYPCVAEFTDGSRPDSKMALLRIMNQLQLVNQRLGKVNRLEGAVTPVAYPLPESQPVPHAYSKLFTVQHVHDDVGWALDCRVRYGMNLIESIPRPEHRLDETYVVSFRVNDPKTPGFLVQTWQRDSGVWKIVSFDIKRNSTAPPADLLTKAINPPGAKPADAKLLTAVETLLTAWLVDRRLDTAKFLPESYACDALADSGTNPAPAKGTENVRKFLEAVLAQSPKQKTFLQAISAAQAAHPDLKPLTHPHDGSYLLAEASSTLMSSYTCGPPANQTSGVLTAFHIRHSKQASAAVISLYWKYLNNEWRIASFTVSAD